MSQKVALPDIEQQIAVAIIDMGKTETSEKMFPIKLAALISLGARCRQYSKKGFMDELVRMICAKKITHVLQAETKGDIDEILGFPKVQFNGNEVLPAGKFHSVEEELIIWSITSLQAPLNEYGSMRYKKVFAEVFPEQAKEVLQ